MSSDRVERELGARPAILIVAPEPFYEDRGTPIATRQIATALATLGFDVDLLAYPVGTDIEIPGVRILRSWNPLRIRNVRIGFSMRKLGLDAGMLFSYLRQTRARRYAVVHAVEEMAFVAAAIRGGDARLIYDMQSSLPDQMRTHAVFRGPFVQGLLRRSERWLMTRADVIVCSAGLRDHVLALQPTAQVTEMLYMSAAAAPKPELAREFRSEFNIPRTAKVVMYSGSFAQYQGLDLFVDAMPTVAAAHPDVVFVLIGASDDLVPGDKAIVSSLRAAGKLFVLPRQDRHKIPSFLAMADVLVSPRSYGDNVPLKVFDYMAAGAPIVATNIKAHRALLDRECAVLVDTSPASLADGISKVIADPLQAAALAARAMQLAGRHARQGTFGSLVSTVYARLCDVPAASGAPRRSGPDATAASADRMLR